MKKFQKLALVAALMATVSGAGMIAGCSEPAAEVIGQYYYVRTTYGMIPQGHMIRTYSDTLTISSDNTFVASSIYAYLYSSDGETYNSIPSFVDYSMEGTYEVVSEDADLGEMTIKITDVTMLCTGKNGYVEVAKENFPADLSEKITTALIGKELILDGANKMSDTIYDLGIATFSSEAN